MRGQSILITGGAGFLGRAILRKAIREAWGSRFTIVSRDETKQDELMRRYGREVDVRCYLGDIAGGLEPLINLMAGHDIVIHAAAVKYIPEAEANRWECERVNVQGSMHVALAARAAGVQTVIGISTDKAVEPVNFYGITKAAMEGLYAEADTWNGPTRFCTVRYGNVVGSTGSVIPKFAAQVAEGRITITDQRMTRFWLSPDSAVELIERAVTGIEEWHGYTLVHACPAMNIGSLAQAVVVASADPAVGVDDVELAVIGVRPGEKLAECLLSPTEAVRAVLWHVADTGKYSDFAIPSPVDRRYDFTKERGEVTWPPAEGYYSAAPLNLVTVSEMAEWIKDAATI